MAMLQTVDKFIYGLGFDGMLHHVKICRARRAAKKWKSTAAQGGNENRFSTAILVSV